MRICRHYRVSGRVQGVFFRAATRQQACALGLTGWVRNLADGRVEGMASAEPARLQLLRNWLKHGPEMARVTKLDVTEQAYQAFDSFEIR
jgi:acylphosphatase